MKCPKCKYNTFEFLDSCKKCGANLRSFKESLGIRHIILPSRRESPPPISGNATIFVANSQVSEDVFSWGTPQSTPSHETAGSGVAYIGLGSHSKTSEESFSFETSFGDLPRFEENAAEEFTESRDTTASTTMGEFALDDFLQEEEIAGSPAQTDTSHAQTDTFAPDEFDFLFDNSPAAGQTHHQG